MYSKDDGFAFVASQLSVHMLWIASAAADPLMNSTDSKHLIESCLGRCVCTKTVAFLNQRSGWKRLALPVLKIPKLGG
jgi:hypothetical protein